MSYQDWAYSFKCNGCQTVWTVSSRAGSRPSFKSTCRNCDGTNFLRHLSLWPDVSKVEYLGVDKNHQLKIHPVPPDEGGEVWAQPYSVRSFLHQASRQLRGCTYSCAPDGSVYGEELFSDTCYDSDSDFEPDRRPCNILRGWSTGTTSCALWEKIADLCQTNSERRFLLDYLRYVKDRQFPMLLPQVRVGIAERRRPDFVLFIPMQRWRYQKLAVQLDGGHQDDARESDSLRDKHLEEYGFETMSLRPDDKGYLSEVQKLVEHVEIRMNMFDSDLHEVAVTTDVINFKAALPF